MDPIYFVVAEFGPMNNGFMYAYKILACAETTLDQYDALVQTVYEPIRQAGSFRAQVLIILREPENPFKDQVFQGSKVP